MLRGILKLTGMIFLCDCSTFVLFVDVDLCCLWILAGLLQPLLMV